MIDPKIAGLNLPSGIVSPILDIKVHAKKGVEVGHHHSDHNSRENSIENDYLSDDIVKMKSITLYESKD